MSTSEYKKAYYQEHKEKYQKWHLDNKDRKRAMMLENKSRYPERFLLAQARRRAKEQGLPFNIELSDIQIPALCPYFNTPITRVFGEGKVGSNPSLDKIDNTLGYVKGNVQVISTKANHMKNNATIEELTSFAIGVLRLHNRN